MHLPKKQIKPFMLMHAIERNVEYLTNQMRLLAGNNLSALNSIDKHLPKARAKFLELLNDPANAERFQNEFSKREFEKANAHHGVICFSGRWDSVLMWSHYANYHKGFCLGFNLEKLKALEWGICKCVDVLLQDPYHLLFDLLVELLSYLHELWVLIQTYVNLLNFVYG